MSNETFNFRKDRFQKIIDKDCVAIDIGAHIGEFSKLFAKCAKKVIAFEPNNFVFQSLESNLKKENLKQKKQIEEGKKILFVNYLKIKI